MSVKPLRMKELAEKYDGEWVLLGEPILKHKRTGQVLGGVVIAHDPDRDTLYDGGIRLKPKSSAILCFKTEPANYAISVFDFSDVVDQSRSLL